MGMVCGEGGGVALYAEVITLFGIFIALLVAMRQMNQRQRLAAQSATLTSFRRTKSIAPICAS